MKFASCFAKINIICFFLIGKNMAWWYYIIIWLISFGIPISCFQWFLSEKYKLDIEALDLNQMFKYLYLYMSIMIFATLVCILLAILYGLPPENFNASNTIR
tara:strand:+ start:146 stop:451 length:306 start_codon:yes stop_codon:yes gene_type:complete